jgi:hypothetical protein
MNRCLWRTDPADASNIAKCGCLGNVTPVTQCSVSSHLAAKKKVTLPKCQCATGGVCASNSNKRMPVICALWFHSPACYRFENAAHA